jgi:hypothetical protein
MQQLINLYPEDIELGDVIEDYLPDDSSRRGEVLNIEEDAARDGYWLRIGAAASQWSLFVERDEELIVERGE